MSEVIIRDISATESLLLTPETTERLPELTEAQVTAQFDEIAKAEEDRAAADPEEHAQLQAKQVGKPNEGFDMMSKQPAHK